MFFLVYWGLKKCSTRSHTQFYKLVCRAHGNTVITAVNGSGDKCLRQTHSKCCLFRGVYPDTSLRKPVLRWILAYLYARIFCGPALYQALQNYNIIIKKKKNQGNLPQNHRNWLPWGLYSSRNLDHTTMSPVYNFLITTQM